MASTSENIDSGQRSTEFRQRLFSFLGENGFIVIFVLWCLFLSFTTDGFATPNNAFTVLRQAAIVGILAIAAHIIILQGDIDLSIAAVLSLCGVLMGGLMVRNGLNPVVAGVIILGIGALIGVVNGLIITGIGINAIITTLGVSSILGGFAFIYTGGKTIYGEQVDAVEFLSRGRMLGLIPIPVIIMFILYLLTYLMLEHTTFGAHIYASGNNRRAAWLAGVKVDRVKIAAFVIAGMLGAIAGIMQVARQGTATAGMGLDFLFPAITAVVLGGASLQGGRGKILNTLIAAIFLTTITNGMILLGVSIYAQRIVSGAILLLALSLDRLRTLRI
jgi:ribose transport system permease protein